MGDGLGRRFGPFTVQNDANYPAHYVKPSRSFKLAYIPAAVPVMKLV